MQISGSGNSALLQHMQAMRTQMFQKADTDKNGGLSLDEFKVAGQDMPGGAQGSKGAQKVDDAFAKIDTNRDGNLTSDEMEAFKPPFDTGAMSAMLSAQESSTSGETDLVSQLMDMLNASDEKRAKEDTSQNATGESLWAGAFNKAYRSPSTPAQSTLSLAA